jgi:hypothetical protein
MAMAALRAFWAQTHQSFPAQHGQMSESHLTSFTIKWGGHLATPMPRRPFKSALYRDRNMTDAIRRHVCDGHGGDVEWDVKSLAHRWTRFSGYWNSDLWI